MAFEGAATQDTEVTAIHEFDENVFVKDRPNVVLIIDMSASMDKDRNGPRSDTRLNRTRDVLANLISQAPLRPHLRNEVPTPRFIDNVDLGVIVFAGSVLTEFTIPITPPDQNVPGEGQLVRDVVRDKLNLNPLTNPADLDVETLLVNNGVPNNENLRDGTNYQAAFLAAADMINAYRASGDGDSSYVILVTDGEPTINNTRDPTIPRNALRNEAVNILRNELRQPGAANPTADGFWMLFVGTPGFGVKNFWRTNLDTDNGDYFEDSDPASMAAQDFDALFDSFAFYISCRSGPMPYVRRADPDPYTFPFRHTWTWLRSANGDDLHPLEPTNDPDDIACADDYEMPNNPTLANDCPGTKSLYYMVTQPDDAIDEDWVYYSEFVCRQLEFQQRRLVFRHGWPSLFDVNRAEKPYGITF